MTIIPFNPQSNQNFIFNPVLDGVNYVAICTYNIYSQRYYLSIYNSARVLIVTNPIVGSPDDYDINLVFGYFKQSTLIYRASSNNFEVNP